MPQFRTFDLDNGLLDEDKESYPTMLYGWNSRLELDEPGNTYFGYVYHVQGSTRAMIETASQGAFALKKGMYFCANEPMIIEGGSGIVVVRPSFKGMPMIGGPIEEDGRLRYIDGCRDSLLIPPPKKGDPCLNALYFPPDVDQTMHTHPSVRAGVIANGTGECITPEGITQLTSGKAFIMPEKTEHKFRTGKSPMTVISYHPDSDFGPEDESHPMINRTIVDGVSAVQIPEIHTK